MLDRSPAATISMNFICWLGVGGNKQKTECFVCTEWILPYYGVTAKEHKQEITHFVGATCILPSYIMGVITIIVHN